MTNFIEEFYYGNLEPQEHTTELTDKVKTLLNSLTEKEEELYTTLKGNELKLFKDYVEGYIKFTSLCNEDSFITGFRFGARFAYDTFDENRKG